MMKTICLCQNGSWHNKSYKEWVRAEKEKLVKMEEEKILWEDVEDKEVYGMTKLTFA